ncbi:hypothetical protein LB503_000332 [Fusarium chuoi]|nr:hypothetical protein LB503_000332 [Fusarium chuoi]
MRNKTHTLVRSQKPISWGSAPIFRPDCACLRPDASTCLHHGQLQSMSFSVNTLTHDANLRHALRSNENKGMSDSPPCCDGTYVVLLGQDCSIWLGSIVLCSQKTNSPKASRRLCRYVNS